jgi:hypothetical protein
MPPETLTFNGVDGASGRYLLPEIALHQLAAAILGETFRGDELAALRARRDAALPDFGVVYGRDPEDLAQVGWALVASPSTPAEVLEALEPLRSLRERQAATRFRWCVGDEGYRQGETKRQFLARFGMASAAPANPDKFPYFVLLVGGPDAIPFEFQYQLDVQYAVGRLSFDTAAEFAHYAEAVVAAETGPGPAREVPRRITLFGTENRADRATKLSATQLVGPLAAEVGPPATDWEVGLVLGEDARKERLVELLAGAQAPDLLFTASHGVAFPDGDPRQRPAQGALLCQDWPGPLLWTKPLQEDFYVAGADIADEAQASPRVVFAFACFGAGTPHRDEFASAIGGQPARLTEAPFVARLPQRLLGRPRGGALAFVGHVERAWACSFVSPSAGAQREVFWSAIQSLLGGRRLGHAMEFFDDRYAALTAELSDDLDLARSFGKALDDVAIAGLWTETKDARNYVVLGDPAVRLFTPAAAGTT